jgi:hypothetical protein
VNAFVRHDDPFTPFDERPVPHSTPVAAMPPHDDILPPVVGDDFRHRVGVKPLDPANWFVRDDEWQPTIDMKRRLLATRRDDVVACTTDADDVVLAAIDEAAQLVLDWTGGSTTNHGIDALVDAALCIPDDLTVLAPVRGDGAARLPFVAGVVCSPSRWRLADKIGLDMLAVHRPVARYAEHIGAAVDVTLERLTEQRPVWRSNWTLEDHPSLFQPAVPERPLVDDPGDLWIRIERRAVAESSSRFAVFSSRCVTTCGADVTSRRTCSASSRDCPTTSRATRASIRTARRCCRGSTVSSTNTPMRVRPDGRRPVQVV